MKGKALVVDDDEMIRNLIKTVLEAEGYETETATNGKEGVDYVERLSQPDNLSVIVLDVCMPEMNGLDVATRLKLNSATQNIPIIMLTGEDKAEDIMAGYSVGADYYITKPFTRQQLLYGLETLFKA